MSRSRKITVECQHCHTRSEKVIWDSINVDLNPELREKIFSYKLFLLDCVHCRMLTPVPYNTIYHDMKHKFMLFFSFFPEEDGDYKKELDTIQNHFSKVMKGYTFRIVYEPHLLKEKIVILELGLNDIAVERQKFCISHINHPEIAEKGYELYFHGIEKPNDEFPYGLIKYIYRDKKEEQLYTLRIAMDEYYEQVLACELDPRMKVEGCTCVDQKWMCQQMRKE